MFKIVLGITLCIFVYGKDMGHPSIAEIDNITKQLTIIQNSTSDDDISDSYIYLYHKRNAMISDRLASLGYTHDEKEFTCGTEIYAIGCDQNRHNDCYVMRVTVDGVIYTYDILDVSKASIYDTLAHSNVCKVYSHNDKKWKDSW